MWYAGWQDGKEAGVAGSRVGGREGRGSEVVAEATVTGKGEILTGVDSFQQRTLLVSGHHGRLDLEVPVPFLLLNLHPSLAS